MRDLIIIAVCYFAALLFLMLVRDAIRDARRVPGPRHRRR